MRSGRGDGVAAGGRVASLRSLSEIRFARFGIRLDPRCLQGFPAFVLHAGIFRGPAMC